MTTPSADTILGHETPIQRLSEQMEAGSLPRSLLYLGPASVGKYPVALNTALALLAPRPPYQQQLRQLSPSLHADLQVVDLEDGAEQIKIHQVRQLQTFLSSTPYQAICKVAIIRHADRLTIEAQQALLKTLEEPPGNATLILVADTEEALLATIHSRLTRMTFLPLLKAEMEAFASSQGIQSETQELLWARFGGRIGAMIGYLQTHSTEELQSEYDSMVKLLSGTPADRLGWSAEQNFDTLPTSLALLDSLLSVWRNLGRQDRLCSTAQAEGQRLIMSARSAAKPGLHFQLLIDNVLLNLPRLKG